MVKVKHQAEIDPEDHDLCKKAFVMAIRDALNVVSGKWKLAIVCTLLSGPKGFADIERLLAVISPRMLTRELRELEVNGAITRTASPGGKSTYILTPSGQELEQVIMLLAGWGQSHRKRTVNNVNSPSDDPTTEP